jgi:hypothetical protein
MDLEHTCYETAGWILCSRTVVRYEHINECTDLIVGEAFIEHLCDCHRLKGTLFDGVQ